MFFFIIGERPVLARIGGKLVERHAEPVRRQEWAVRVVQCAIDKVIKTPELKLGLLAEVHASPLVF
ncbi:MAG: hypothetical protein ACLQKK_12040 [Rhodomicrobium sp.]